MQKYVLKHTPETGFVPSIDYKSELNEEQYRVVTEGEGPCLVLAGAGSGKTRTLVYRVAYLVERGVHPSNILLVTFTNKASHEMLGRVEAILKRDPKGLWGGTYHHLANRLLRKYAPALDYQTNFNILDADDAKSLLKTVIAELGINTKDKYFPKVDLIHALLSFSENSRSPIEDVIAYKYKHINEALIPRLRAIADAYRKKKLASNVMDFDDLLVNWYRLLDEHPDIRAKLKDQFQYILVDEYQDTNKIQGMIIERLANEAKNILVVGDDAQSIYSFRAATVDNILNFPKEFSGTRTFKLEENYRSASTILDVANASIAQNSNQFKKKLRGVKEGGTKPTIVPCGDNYKQARFIAQRVLELTDGGTALNDIAVLFRSTYQVPELELELNKRGIPYIVRGGIRFFEQAHIKDIVAFLRVFANNRDELAWMRILQLFSGVGPSTAKKMWAGLSGYDTIAKVLHEQALMKFARSGKAAEALSTIHRVFMKLATFETDFVASAITELLKYYEGYGETHFENWRDRLEDLRQLANFSATYATLDAFLSDVSLSEGFRGERARIANDAAGEKMEDRLVLSTIHQAKGLEWHAVFVMHLAEGQFPSYRVYENPREIEEERRLFYVAVTRAKEELYLSFPVLTHSYTMGEVINRPSTFLSEIPEDLFDKWQIEEEEVIQYKEEW